MVTIYLDTHAVRGFVVVKSHFSPCWTEKELIKTSIFMKEIDCGGFTITLS